MDWSDWLDLAIGRLGLMPDVFYAMTRGEFARYAYYHDCLIAGEWDHTRHLRAAFFRAMGAKQNDCDPQKMLPLWIDKIGEEEAGMVIKAGSAMDEALARMEAKHNETIR